MKKNVMVVDDDQEMLLSLKDGLEIYDETLSVLMAGDGVVALEKLKENSISLVISDLKMPRMDGVSLMTRMHQLYPDIPVIVITGYGTPETAHLARKVGAEAYVEKPFMIKELAGQIVAALKKTSDGGTLNNVSSGMFLQLMEMEERTCTIRLLDNATGRQGVLFFRDGELLDARIKGSRGESAAHEIFSWEEVNLSIQDFCPLKEKRLEGDLRAILLEAMRLKDEQDDTRHRSVPETPMEGSEKIIHLKGRPLYSFEEKIRAEWRQTLGDRSGLEDIYQDPTWDGMMLEIARIGEICDAGEFRVGYISRDQAEDFILLPGQGTTVLRVNRKCPRDRIMQTLSAILENVKPEIDIGEDLESPVQ